MAGENETIENNDEQLEQVGDNIRADMEAAISEVENDFEGSAAKKADDDGTPESTPGAKAPEGKSLDDRGRNDETPGDTTGVNDDADANAGYPDDATDYPTLNADKVTAAPETWRPAAREGWAELPESTRREIHRRELDIANGLQGNSEHSRVAKTFHDTVAPYMSVIAAEGLTDPMQAVGGLLKTASQLKLGTPAAKANAIAGMCQHYGIDFDLLDTALAASVDGKANGAADDPVASLIDEKFKPFSEFMTTIQKQVDTASQRSNESAGQTVEEFAKTAEFLPDVRMEMADLMDMATARNRVMTIQQAYDTACNLNPEIRAVLAARAAGTSQESDAQRLAAKRNLANTSLTGRQHGTGDPVGKGDGSIRGDMVRAIEQLEEIR